MTPAIFQSSDAKLVIDYIRETYGDELEFLWERSPSNAIWRNQQNRKWYGAMLTVHPSKLGLSGDETLEILDLRLQPEIVMEIIDGEKFFPGYHMNKQHWITVKLDGSLTPDELYRLIDNSYKLSWQKA